MNGILSLKFTITGLYNDQFITSNENCPANMHMIDVQPKDMFNIFSANLSKGKVGVVINKSQHIGCSLEPVRQNPLYYRSMGKGGGQVQQNDKHSTP